MVSATKWSMIVTALWPWISNCVRLEKRAKKDELCVCHRSPYDPCYYFPNDSMPMIVIRVKIDKAVKLIKRWKGHLNHNWFNLILSVASLYVDHFGVILFDHWRLNICEIQINCTIKSIPATIIINKFLKLSK